MAEGREAVPPPSIPPGALAALVPGTCVFLPPLDRSVCSPSMPEKLAWGWVSIPALPPTQSCFLWASDPLP